MPTRTTSSTNVGYSWNGWENTNKARRNPGRGKNPPRDRTNNQSKSTQNNQAPKGTTNKTTTGTRTHWAKQKAQNFTQNVTQKFPNASARTREVFKKVVSSPIGQTGGRVKGFVGSSWAATSNIAKGTLIGIAIGDTIALATGNKTTIGAAVNGYQWMWWAATGMRGNPPENYYGENPAAGTVVTMSPYIEDAGQPPFYGGQTLGTYYRVTVDYRK